MSYDNRYRACWPIPGGSRGSKEYLENLRAILYTISSNQFTIDELAQHVAAQFGAKVSWVRESLRICIIYTSLAKLEGGVVRLTEDAREYLRTGDETILAKCFCENIWGFKEILHLLKERPIETSELFTKLKQLGANWEYDHQVRHRIEWLKSFGLVESMHRKYCLTQKGLLFVNTLEPFDIAVDLHRDSTKAIDSIVGDEDKFLKQIKKSSKPNSGYLGSISKRTESFMKDKVFKQQNHALLSEYIVVENMETEFNTHLNKVIGEKFEEVVQFGKNFNSSFLESYLVKNFGEKLFFDPLLTLIQQYAIADVDIINEGGYKVDKTGFNLALFGDPGTGKTFATKDFILGDENKDVPAHGLPGRNRYCGGMTPARFIQIGKAYEGRKFVFIVPELREWFTHSPGMVEPLKLAMEHGVLTKETFKEVIEPYRFTSFFSVNYNAMIKSSGDYKVSMRDPNFNAIEDRMLCRLHVLTKERYMAIAETQTKKWRGEIKYELADKIRDHLTLIHAVETGNPKVKGILERKPILLTTKFIDMISEARQRILDEVDYEDVLKFSPRLETRVLQVAAALSLVNYFRYQYSDVIPLNDHAMNTALRFYFEEIFIRLRGIR